jgi:hypothetical protein
LTAQRLDYASPTEDTRLRVADIRQGSFIRNLLDRLGLSGGPRTASSEQAAERRASSDRRAGADRRLRDEGPPDGVERRSGTDRRSGADRRSGLRD